MPAAGDFNGGGITDYGVYRLDAGLGRGQFHLLTSPDGVETRDFGGPGDAPIVADYDGDGADDVAVYGFSPLEGRARFAVLPSSGGSAITLPIGSADSIGLPRPPGTAIGLSPRRVRNARPDLIIPVIG